MLLDLFHSVSYHNNEVCYDFLQIYTIFSNISATHQWSKMMEFKEELLPGLNVVMLKAGNCVRVFVCFLKCANVVRFATYKGEIKTELARWWGLKLLSLWELARSCVCCSSLLLCVTLPCHMQAYWRFS